MKKIILSILLLPMALFGQETILISAVMDGDVSGGNPKMIELYAKTNIADLSVFGLESGSNGAASSGTPEFTFDAVALSAGEFIYVTTNQTALESYFTHSTDGNALSGKKIYVDNVASINGNDPVYLYKSGAVVDAFGAADASGANFYQDSYAQRKFDKGPNSSFDISEWTISSVDGCSTTDEDCSVKATIGSYLYAATVTEISSNTTWDGNKTISGKIVVQDGATLTINAGTVVKAAFAANPVDATALIVAKGGKLNAVGTADQPIIFTTEYDDLTAADVDAGTLVSTVSGAANDLTERGLWGGIIMLGKGIVGEDGGEDDIEGVAEGYDFTTYGGSVADDNSGTLDYVSIRHGGATIANGDEINGLTLGGVGSGTSIKNIEIISNDDDGIEFFGGNVNVTNILIFNQKDDAIDIDEAYAGTITNAYVAMGADSDNVFEIDGSEDSTGTVTGSYTIDGVTAYQAYNNSGKLDQYGHWKSGATGANQNIVFKGFAAGTYLEGVEKATFDAGTLTFSNLDFVTTDDLATVNSVGSRGANDELAVLTATHAEVIGTQKFDTGANEGKFAGWTAYGSVNPFTVNVGDGTLTYISADATWDGTYNMSGKVVVQDGATLTINAGTVVKAAFTANPVDATALIVAKGGKLNAVGTADQPIIFTTEYDDLTAADVDAGTLVSTVSGAANDLTERGLWGGIIMLGKGIVGEDGGEDDIEGVAEGYDFTTYGGSVADDNSGTLDYVSIRHGGATIANGDEINGLTLGGVGSGTSIKNIEIISNDDDGIEFFGGNVNVTNILIFNQKDDAIDIDEAYAGTITNAYVAMGADSDNVFEIDGSEDSTGTVTGSYTIDGVTAYQAYNNSGKLDQYGHWKSGATGANQNIVFKGFAAGTYLEGVEKATFDAGTLTFSNLDFVTTDDLATVNSVGSRGANDELAVLTATHAEVIGTQKFDTGANEGKFAGWTAYGSVNPFTVNVGDGTLTYISADATWDGTYNMSGKVVVQDGATLTINAGTVVKAAFTANPVDATALIVAKGGKLNAVGTADQPIIFTTEYDDLTAADVDAGTLVSTVSGAANDLTERGLWGGIIMLGKGIVGEDGGEDDIEGVAEGYDFTTYGGSVADDNSGTLDYVSIRHGGATIANGDEINGLTLGGVGSGTSIKNIEIISNDDDGIEFFGGNVNVTNILIFNQKDDAIDIDEAYAGTITNAYVAMGADSDNVFEIDGSEDSTGTVTGSYTIDGVTAYQAYNNSGKLDQYGHWKSGATGANQNIVFKGFAAGTYLEGVEKATFDAGTLTFSNLDFVTTDDLATVNSVGSRGANDELAVLTATHAEVIGAQAANTGADESKFTEWTAYAFVNTTFSFEEIFEVKSTISYYPNPTNGIVNIDSESRVNEINVYSISGQLVEKVIRANSINIENVRSGIYVIEIITDEQKVQGKLIRK